MAFERTASTCPSALLALAVCLVSTALGVATVHAAALVVGDSAPDFELQGSDGVVYRLKDLLAKGGKQGIVLAWFPKAFTPG